MDLNRINEEINRQPEAEITVASLSGIEKYTVEEGTTVADFREANEISNATKLITADTQRTLKNTDVLTAGMQIVMTTSKKNG